MANPLDLEEQEQLAALRHFWNRWGGLISWALIVVLTALTAWNGWQLWQRRQAQAASRLFDEISAAVEAQDTAGCWRRARWRRPAAPSRRRRRWRG